MRYIGRVCKEGNTWYLVRGTGRLAHSSWLMAHGAGNLGLGTWYLALGTWNLAVGSLLIAHSRLVGHTFFLPPIIHTTAPIIAIK
ncbi:MAG: hypothetical protein ABFC57_04150 [Veillonellales bacterium]